MIRIINSDAGAELRKIATDSVDIVLTSPPYNIGKEYERRVALEAYENWIRPIAAGCCRVLAPGGSLCWQVGNYINDGEVFPLDFLFIPMFEDLGMVLRHRAIWHFGHGLHATHRFSGRHETVLWFTKPGADRHHYAAACEALGATWKITNVKHNHPEKTAHPCQFPEELVRHVLSVVGRPGQTIIDPFSGAGTTGVVAGLVGMNAILIDREPAYAAIAEDRMRRAHGLFANLEVT